MPISQHPVFTPAPSPTAALWRYMGLPAFLSLIQRSTLCLSNLELLSHRDPFEGTLPPATFKHRDWTDIADAPREVRDRLPSFLKPGETDLTIGFRRYKDLVELRIRQAYSFRRAVFVSCWHLSEHESSAMWSVYSRLDEGIAIVSCEERMQSALEDSQGKIYGGMVQYEDFSALILKFDNSLTPIVYKRSSFAYESEYRLAHLDTSVTHKELIPVNDRFEWEGETYPAFGAPVITVGRSDKDIEAVAPRPVHEVRVDINRLIAKVYVSPLSPDWVFDTVKASATAFGLRAPVEKSPLYSKPLR